MIMIGTEDHKKIYAKKKGYKNIYSLYFCFFKMPQSFMRTLNGKNATFKVT